MAVEAIRSGGAATDTFTNLKYCTAKTTGADHYMTFEYPVGTDYRIDQGGSKLFYITKILIIGDVVNAKFVLGYGDGGAGVASAGVAPTGWTQVTQHFSALVIDEIYTIDNISISMPNDKEPCMLEIGSQVGNINVHLWGIEK